MSTGKIILITIIVLLVLAGIGVAIYLTNTRNDIRSRAQSADTSSSCQTPDIPGNVYIKYPGVTPDGIEVYTQATCTWNAISNASSYTVTITEKDSNTSFSPATVTPPTAQYTFTVNPNKTYICQVVAVNSCGQSGQPGSFEKLCKIEGIVDVPASPTPTPTPTPTPSPVPTPTPSTAPAAISCGNVGCASAPCQAGLTCIQSANGQSYCTRPEYANACQQAGGVVNCCNAPIASPKPRPSVLVNSGSEDQTYLIFVAAIGMLFFGSFLVAKSFRK